MTELEKQIEAAYDYRGHVTIGLKDGQSVEGFIFNRQPQFIEVFLKGSGDRRRYETSDLRSVALTGEDCAAGKSFDDYQKKKLPI